MKPLFFTVTGADFARSIAWAKRTPNQVSQQLKAATSAAIRANIHRNQNNFSAPP